MSGLQELVSSAFGSNVCLYKDVLKCSSKATPSELRRAYHKRALLYHPDKHQHQESSENRLQDATLKFQALSAAYQLLSNQSQRTLYDTTGRIPKPVDENEDTDPSKASSGHSGGYSHKTNSTEAWVQFFQSVFQDIIKAGNKFDRQDYCGSEEERENVLHYYQLCKGDRSKMMSCIVQSEQEDLERWWKDILQPAIGARSIQTYEEMTCDGASSILDMDEKKTNKRKKLIRKRKRSVAKNKELKQRQVQDCPAVNDLEDTDDDEDAKQSGSNIPKARAVMSRKEKMEFRVAKKRKEKKEREIEMAEIMQSKQWTGASSIPGRSKQRRNQHGLSESFLSGLQEKFSNSETPRGKKKKQKRR